MQRLQLFGQSRFLCHSFPLLLHQSLSLYTTSELNGTNWVKTQYINKSTGEPIANKAAQIYVLGDEIDGIIYAQTDENGWLSVKNIPDGVECYVDFVD